MSCSVMNDFKLNFPKLKAYSQSQTNASARIASHKLKTLGTDQSTPKSTNMTLQEKLANLKYQYVNKSPQYFKNRKQSVVVLGHPEESKQSIEEYIGEQTKLFDKEMLLELARSRVRKIHKQQQARKKEENQNSFSKGSPLDQLHNMKESKYENFRPMRLQLKHTIKCIQHPDLTILPKSKETI